MTQARLARLLSPRSIAIIGGREAEEVVRQCERIGFSGALWPVNPRRAEMLGRKCFASLADLPAPPDAAFVAIPREAAIAAVDELARLGAAGAVVYASGFSEVGADGAALERELVRASGEMAMIGPNCYGALNYLDGAALWPDQHGGKRVERGVAIVLQSGNIAVNLTMQTRGLPIAYVVAAGNKAKGDMADYVEAFLADERVTAIGLHIEGLDDIAAFSRAALRARAQRKPIVALKAGRSERGAALTMSHTASLAGPDKLYEALFARLGVARAPDLSVFLETLKLFHVLGPLEGARIASMSCSGGEASLIADLAHAAGLATPEPPEAARAALAQALGPKVTISNPLDYHTYIWGDLDGAALAFSAMLGAGYDLSALVLDFPRAERCDPSNWETTLAALERARRATGAPAAVIASLPECLPEAIAERLIEQGIAPLAGMGEALAAIRLAADVGSAFSRAPSPPLAAPAAPPRNVATLDEARSKAALAEYGLAVPAFRIASALDAPAIAAAIGFPVVVKALSSAIAHKSDVGGVRLNLGDAEAVAAATAAMADLSERFLIEPMRTGALAEAIGGVTRDPQFGLALTFGAGGVLVDLLDDHATLILPTTRLEIERALDGLRLAKFLSGYRGGPRADRNALVDALQAIARYAEANRGRLAELDVNPILVFAEGEGVSAVDALVRIGEEVSP